MIRIILLLYYIILITVYYYDNISRDNLSLQSPIPYKHDLHTLRVYLNYN